MRNNIIKIVLILIGCIHSVSSQNFKGILVDEEKKPIEFANIIAQYVHDDSLINGVVSDEKGNFNLAVVADKPFYITISFIGYKIWKKERVTIESPDLGEIILELAANKLKEVVVEANKKLITRKGDRLVFNVQQSLASVGGDAVDVLKVTPGLKILNDEVYMIGKDNIRLMINGKLQVMPKQEVMNFLSAISSDDIKTIEVINNPPAKYEAEGNSGLVNIVYKKGRKNSWSSRIRSVYNQSTYAKGSLSGSFFYQKNKVNINSSLFYTNGSKLITDSNTFYFDDVTWNAVLPRRFFSEPSLSGRFLLDYNLSKDFTIGFQYLGSYGRYKTDNNNDRIEVVDRLTSNLDYVIKTQSNSIEKVPSHTLNLHSDFKIDSVTKVDINLDYFSFKNEQDRVYTTFNESNGVVDNGTLDVGNNIGDQEIENYSAKLDFTSSLKWAQLSYGGKLSYTKSQSSISFFDLTTGTPVNDLSKMDDFDYKENTQSLYFSLEKQFNQKWSGKFGVRYENTETTGESLTLSEVNNVTYDRLFPTVNLNYMANEKNIFSATFNSRITRPSFEFLNPFVNVQNTFTIVEGNPYLQPSFSDNFSLTHIYKQKVVTSLYYSQVNNGFQQLAEVDPDTNIQAISPQNYYETSKIGLTESYTFRKFKRWESVNVLDIHYSKSKSLVAFTNEGQNGWNTYLATNNSFVLNSSKSIRASINYWYSLPGVYDIYKTSSGSSLDLGLKFLFMNKNLQLGINANDIFKGQRIRVTGVTNDVNVSFRNYYDTQRFRISVLYKFGNKKIRVKRRGFGNKEEKARTKK